VPFKKLSLDFKLIAAFMFVSMLLSMLSFMGLIYFRLLLSPALFFGVVFLIAVVFSLISARHKRKHGWSWHRPSAQGLGMAGGSLLGGAVMIFLNANLFDFDYLEYISGLTALFAAIIGVMSLFGVMVGLNLADLTQKQFLIRTGQIDPEVNVKEPDKFKPLTQAFKIYFFVTWLSAAYLVYSIAQYEREKSPKPTETQTVMIEDDGDKYYVTENGRKAITTKKAIIIPMFLLAIIFPLFIKARYKIDLLEKPDWIR